MSTGSSPSSHDLATILSAMREGLQVIDREWRYVFLNEAAAAHGRQRREDLVGRTMMDCYPGIDQTDMFVLARRCMNERTSAAMVNTFTYPDGQALTFELRIEPCDVGLMILSIDITEGRNLEEQLRQAQKMEAIGRLAGSVAHDFNNLLSVILSYSTLVLGELKAVDPLRADVEAIKRAGERAAELTHQLLAFSRRQVLAPKIVDLNDVVRQSERMLQRLLGEDIELVTRLNRCASKVKVDPGQIDQVIMNLALNARDAMPNGGKLTIETNDAVLDEAYALDHFGVRSGAHVMLAISDTGVGMDKETQSRIFEPFFTTKSPGKGTGLGLSTVFGIVQQSGGHVWVYSEPGAGASFKVYLPKAAEGELPHIEQPEPATLEGSETILLVEDQEEVRRVACEVLRRFGYHVIEARNPGEALLECERHPRTIHLLLTDVVMPRMNGRELAERLLKIRPNLRVLYMSGYTENAIVHHGILDSGIAYLQKPLVPDALGRRVREVLDMRVRKSGPPEL
jgi:two-component system cell cycle sensor histidine kinase/response regulator CckA